MESLKSRLLRHEGMRLNVYKDHLGFDTIGVGRLLSNGINQDEALYMLDNDIERCKKEVNKELPWVLALDPVRRDVLYEMCFQMGIYRLLLFKKMLRACKDLDYDTAAQEMLSSSWHKQTPARCEELAAVMLGGK